jgi:hypothetical protein
MEDLATGLYAGALMLSIPLTPKSQGACSGYEVLVFHWNALIVRSEENRQKVDTWQPRGIAEQNLSSFLFPLTGVNIYDNNE